MTPSHLGAEIHRLREASGLTLEQLAAQARISRSTLVKIEGGATPDPGFSVVARLLSAAGATDEQVLLLHCAAVQPWRPRLLGVGYEGLDQDGLVAQLTRERVQVVADVRLTPLSRKRGLSKVALAERLEAEGINYRHLRALGNPRANRPGYSDPHDTSVRKVYRERLQGQEAQAELAELRQLAKDQVVALLCFENDQRVCHRAQVLEALTSRA